MLRIVRPHWSSHQCYFHSEKKFYFNSNSIRDFLSEVIQGHTFWRQSKARVRLYIGRYNSNFCFIFNRFGDIAGFICPESTVQVSK